MQKFTRYASIYGNTKGSNGAKAVHEQSELKAPEYLVNYLVNYSRALFMARSAVVEKIQLIMN